MGLLENEIYFKTFLDNVIELDENRMKMHTIVCDFNKSLQEAPIATFPFYFGEQCPYTDVAFVKTQINRIRTEQNEQKRNEIEEARQKEQNEKRKLLFEQKLKRRKEKKSRKNTCKRPVKIEKRKKADDNSVKKYASIAPKIENKKSIKKQSNKQSKKSELKTKKLKNVL
jgi:hypothetical protein